MAGFFLVLSLFASTLISSDQQPEIWLDEDVSAEISTYMSKQKESAFKRIMTGLLAKDWPFYEPILHNIALYFQGYAEGRAQNLNGMDGVIAGARFLEKLITIHKNHVPHSDEKLQALARLLAEIKTSVQKAHNSPLVFSATALQKAQFAPETQTVLMNLRKSSEREYDTYGCTTTLPLLPGFGCGIGNAKNILGYLKPACSLMLAWAAPLPTFSVGHYREMSYSPCNCYFELRQEICCIGINEYHDAKSDISECGIGCMNTNRCLASGKIAFPFSLGQDCLHFATKVGLEVKDINPDVYQLIKEEWRSLINDSTSMEELKKALQKILFEIASETTTYFQQH